MKKYGDYFREWGFSNIKLNAGFAEFEFSPKEDDMTAAWDMYVELITRITTQKLEPDTGDEKTALSSVYSLFAVTRDILKEKGRNAKEFTRIAVIILNQVVRPFTAKWHRKSLENAFDDLDECANFREELETLQIELCKYSSMLAQIAKVEDLTDIS